MPAISVPPLTTVLPLYVFGPVRVSEPLPVFCNPISPVVFWIVPLKVLVALLLPTVRVYMPLPLALSIVPLPHSPLTEGWLPLSKSRPLTVRSPLPRALVLPRTSVPWPTVVLPV